MKDHKIEVTIKAISNNGHSFTESQRRDIQEYLLKTAGKYLESQGFSGQVDVERVSIFHTIGVRIFG